MFRAGLAQNKFCYSATANFGITKAPSSQIRDKGAFFCTLSVVAGAAETDDSQAAIGMGNVPAGATGIVRGVVPGAAAHHFVFVTEERGLVSAVWVGLIPVSNPLPDVPRHVAGIVGADPVWLAPYGCRVADAIVRV